MNALNSSRPTARRLLVAAALAGGALVTDASAAAAQAYSYPAFQPPEIVAREYTGLVADGGRAGTSLVFQWREGLTSDSQVSIDAGLADPDGGDARILLGAGYGLQVNRVAANADFPLDVMLTAGAYGNFGDGRTEIRLPVGASLGRRFLLDGNFAITPFFHPRASVNFCSECDGGEGDVDVGLNFDLGANFELTPVLSIRAAVMFGGDEPDAFGLGLSWRPRALR